MLNRTNIMPNSPNILLITTDQQRCDSLGCYGTSWARTPAIDGLADHCDDPDHLRPRMIVTQDDKRTVYTDRSFGEYFDLRSDSDERHNVRIDSVCEERRADLQNRLNRHPVALPNPVPGVALA